MPHQAGAQNEIDGSSARTELVNGTADLLAEWERGDDLCGEGAEKIVSWILSHERIHEAVTQSVRYASHVLRVDRSPI
jgi:hypothetical protein